MNRILITVIAGIAEVDQSTIPAGIEVEIRDYDVLDYAEDIKQDEHGEHYAETLWSRIE